MIDIPTSKEKARGCGYRQPGGLYLMAGKPNEACELLPVPMKACPVCGGGIKPARSWTWVDGDELLGTPTEHGSQRHNRICPLAKGLGDRCGLIWIGGAFYATPDEFMREARSMGVSRRINALPKGYDPANPPIVLLGHREGAPCADCVGRSEDERDDCDTCGGTGKVPAVFSLFRPERVEYVVNGQEEDDELERMIERGIQPIRVIRDYEEADDDA